MSSSAAAAAAMPSAQASKDMDYEQDEEEDSNSMSMLSGACSVALAMEEAAALHKLKAEPGKPSFPPGGEACELFSQYLIACCYFETSALTCLPFAQCSRRL